MRTIDEQVATALELQVSKSLVDNERQRSAAVNGLDPRFSPASRKTEAEQIHALHDAKSYELLDQGHGTIDTEKERDLAAIATEEAAANRPRSAEHELQAMRRDVTTNTRMMLINAAGRADVRMIHEVALADLKDAIDPRPTVNLALMKYRSLQAPTDVAGDPNSPGGLYVDLQQRLNTWVKDHPSWDDRRQAVLDRAKQRHRELDHGFQKLRSVISGQYPF